MLFTTADSQLQNKSGNNPILKIYLIIFIICWTITFINTPDRSNWFTENTLTVIFITLLIYTFKKFRFSDLSYTLFSFIYCCISMEQSIHMLKIHLVTGLKMFFILTVILMTVSFIFLLASCLLTLCWIILKIISDGQSGYASFCRLKSRYLSALPTN